MTSLFPTLTNSVSAQFANTQNVQVYGKYKEVGYETQPVYQSLGESFDRRVSASEAFAIAGLDWTAEKRNAFYEGLDGPVILPDKTVIVRSDTDHPLGIHGSAYEPIQQQDLINVVDSLGSTVTIENVLSIRGGAKTYVTCSIDTEQEVLPGDRIRRYLHIFNSHDGSAAYGAFFTDVRLTCANQLSSLSSAARKACRDGRGLTMRHTSGVRDFAHELPGRIDVFRRTFDADIQSFRAMVQTPLTEENAKAILERTYANKLSVPVKDRSSGEKRQRVITDLAEHALIKSHYGGGTGIGTEHLKGSVFGLYNAITQYETHDRGRRRTGNEADRARANLERLWGGEAGRNIEAAKTACLAAV